VTHDQEEALEVADQIVVMNEGRIEQVGTPDEVFHRPATEFVLNFLGNVNLFHGRVEEGRAVFGGLAVDVADAEHADGRAARLLVRPYDLQVYPQRPAALSLSARLTRVQAAGPTVKLELQSPDGQLIHVEMSHDEFRQMRLQVGDNVFVRPKESRVFVDDYSI
jgi:sulfate transport system ATP-binding protein